MLSFLPWKAEVIPVALLSVCYLLQSSCLLIQTSSTTLAASRLLAGSGGSANLATLPFSLIFIVAAILPPLFAWSFQRFGFRATFLTSTALGLLGGLLATMAIYVSSFPLICAASALLGVPNTAGNFFRFAVSTLVEPKNGPRAVSALLFFGLVASFLGPFIADSTYLLLPPYEYLPVYIAVCGLYVLLGMVLCAVPFKPTEGQLKRAIRAKDKSLTTPFLSKRSAVVNERNGDSEEESERDDGDEEDGGEQEAQREAEEPAPPRRTWGQLVTTPAISVAILGASIAYLVMISVMIMVPVVMEDLEFDFSMITDVMTVHGIGMFLPFFFTGFVIERVGEVAVTVSGMCVLGLSVGLFLISTDKALFFSAMALLGIGWSLAFVGSTVLLMKQPTPAERPMLIATNDVVVFGLVAVSTICASVIYNALDWTGYLYLNLGFVGFGIAVVLSYSIALCKK